MLGLQPRDLIHMGARQDFPIYVLAKNWQVHYRMCSIHPNQQVQIPNDESWPKNTPALSDRLITPVQIYSEALAMLEADPKARTSNFYLASKPDDQNDPEEICEFRLVTNVDHRVEGGVEIGTCTLVVMATDLPDDAPLTAAKVALIPPSKSNQPKQKAPTKFVSALIRLLLEINNRASKLDEPVMLNIAEMPGIKKNLWEVACKFDPSLDLAERSFDDYLDGLIQFKRGAQSVTFYKGLFPEPFI